MSDPLVVTAVLDPAAAKALGDLITNAITAGFAGANKASERFFKKAGENAKNSFDSKMFDDLLKGLKDSHAEALKTADAFKKSGNDIRVLLKTIQSDSEAASKKSIEAREKDLAALRRAKQQERIAAAEALTGISRAQAEALAHTKANLRDQTQAARAAFDAEGRAQRESIEQGLISATTASKQRIAITRGLVKTIENLEQALGATVAGIARTTVSAISRSFHGLSSGLGRIFQKDSTEIRSSNTVLRSSLVERSSVLRENLSKQEKIVRESVTRQEKQFTRLRTLGSTGVAGAVTGRGIGFGVGGLIAGIGIGTLFKNGFTDATNYTEQLNKTRKVFGQFADEVIAFAQDAPTKLGTTRAKALEATGTFGNLFRAIGLTEEMSTKFSLNLTTLATDLASLGNTSVEDAFQAIRSGLVGEQEPLRKFGVTLDDATLKAKALELGLYSGKGVLEASAKAQAAYAIILAKTVIAQGDFADTSKEGANAQKVFGAQVAEFFSALASQLKGFVTAILVGAVPVIQTLTSLVTGEGLSGALEVLREALKGVALGLGAVLAVKAGVEVIQLLGAAAKIALSPMGLLVIGAGLLGAAIQLGIGPFDGFGEALAFAKARLGDLHKLIIDRVVPAVQIAAQFVREKLVSAFHTAVGFLESKVLPVLKTVGSWIVDVLLPILGRFAERARTDIVSGFRISIAFLQDKVLPVLKMVGETAQRWFGVALEAVKSFWHFVEPIIAPLISGFKNLGSAIASAFSGDFSKILGGLGSAGAGIGRTFANIGVLIFDALKPLGPKILDFFKGVFSGPNLSKLAIGFLDFIEAVGRFLGTHLDFIVEWTAKIAAALAVAAGAIAGKFVIGFVDGLRKSGPVIIGGIFDVFKAALGLAFDNIGVVLIALVALKIGASLVSAFKKAGTSSGDGFLSGFKGAVGNTRGFLGGLLGQPTILQSSQGTLGKMQREAAGLTHQFQILGSTKVVDIQNIQEGTKALDKLRAGFSPAQLAGVQAADKMKAAFRGIGAVLTGNLAALKTVALEQGTTVGKFVGKGVAIGLASAVGGFFTGRAAGAAGVSPITAGLTTGLTAGLLTSNPIIGVVAGAGAAIGAAFGGADKAAKDLAARISTLAGTIRGVLKSALDAGTLSALTFKGALEGTTGQSVSDALLGSFSDKDLITLDKAGIKIQEILAALKSGNFGVVQTKINLAFPTPGETGDVTVDAPAADKAAKARADALAIVTNAQKAYSLAIEVQTAAQNVGNAVTKEAAAATLALAGQYRAMELGVRAATPTIAAQYKAMEEGVRAAATPTLDLVTGLEGITEAIADAAKASREAEIGVLKGKLDIVDAVLVSLNGRIDEYIEKIGIAFGTQPTGAEVTVAALEGISGAIADIAAIDPATLTILDAAHLDEAKATIATQLQAVIAQGIKDGTIKGVDDAKLVTLPLYQSALEDIGKLDIPQAEKDALAAQIAALFNDGFISAQPAIDAAVAAQQQAVVQGASQTALQVAIAFNSQLVESGRAGAETVAAYTKGIVDAKDNPAAAAAQAALGVNLKIRSTLSAISALGVQALDGLSGGLKDPKALARLSAAATAAARVITAATAKALESASPSKVMYRLGAFAGEGLALGLADSVDGIGSIITDALDKAIDKATTAAEKAKLSLQATFGSLFDFGTSSSGPPGDPALTKISATSSITQALQSFLSSFDSTVATAFATAAAANEAAAGTGPALTAAQLDIFGESAFSLDPKDVLGAGNLAVLIQALAAVKDAGKSLLAEGLNPQAVADLLSTFTAQITDQAKALGFNADNVDYLTAQLGLSSDALAAFVLSTEQASAAFLQATADLAAAAAAAATEALLPQNVIADILAGKYDTKKNPPIDPDELGKKLGALPTETLLSLLTATPGILDVLGLGDGMSVADAILAILLKWGPGAEEKAAGPYSGGGSGGQDGSDSQGTGSGINGDRLGGNSLPVAGTTVFHVYPPTTDPYAFALGVANSLAASAYVP